MHGLANCKLLLGRFQDALTDCECVLECNPTDNLGTMLVLADLRLRLGQDAILKACPLLLPCATSLLPLALARLLGRALLSRLALYNYHSPWGVAGIAELPFGTTRALRSWLLRGVLLVRFHALPHTGTACTCKGSAGRGRVGVGHRGREGEEGREGERAGRRHLRWPSTKSARAHHKCVMRKWRAGNANWSRK